MISYSFFLYPNEKSASFVQKQYWYLINLNHIINKSQTDRMGNAVSLSFAFHILN